MGKTARAAFCVAAFGWMAAHGQSGYSKRDSGWVPLFNGRDFEGLYIRNGGGTLRDPASQASYLIEGGAIRVPKTGGVGHLATRAIYSRYQVRVHYKYGPGQANPNAGLLYHIDTLDWIPGSANGSKNPAVPYFFGAYVKSVELQTYRGDAGAFLGIMNIWVTADTKGDANHTWQAGGTPYTAFPSEDLQPRRIYRSRNAAPSDTDWVLLEGLIHGSDSVIHRVNGEVVMMGRDLLHNGKTSVSAETAGRTPLDKGHVGLQSEGAEVWYRDWEIRLLRKDGTPIIPGCTDARAPNFLPIANQDDGSCKPLGIGRAGRSGVPRLHVRNQAPVDALGRLKP
jgi:hypothetical protein